MEKDGTQTNTTMYVHAHDFPPKKITTLTVQNIAQQNMIAYNKALFQSQKKKTFKHQQQPKKKLKMILENQR